MLAAIFYFISWKSYKPMKSKEIPVEENIANENTINSSTNTITTELQDSSVVLSSTLSTDVTMSSPTSGAQSPVDTSNILLTDLSMRTTELT